MIPRPKLGVRSTAVVLAGIPVALGVTGLGLPAGWLVGPMVVALLAATTGWATVEVPLFLWRGAQAVIGVAIGATFTPSSLAVLASDWGAVAASVVTVLGLSLGAGWALGRLGGVTPATAALGTLPGGASGMVAMSEDLGADIRLVAFMQYLRLLLTVLSVTLVATLLPAGPEAPRALASLNLRAPTPGGLAATAALALIGALLGPRLHLPAGALVFPLLVAALLGAFGVGVRPWPSPALDAAYAVVGLRVGGRFDRESLRLARRIAPAVFGFVAALMAACAALGALITAVSDIDPLTAYLATAPGGMDSVAIVALDTGANTSIVLGIQLARVLVVILVGPMLIKRLLARGP